MEKYILLGPFRVPGCVLFGNRFQYPQILTSTGPAVWPSATQKNDLGVFANETTSRRFPGCGSGFVSRIPTILLSDGSQLGSEYRIFCWCTRHVPEHRIQMYSGPHFAGWLGAAQRAGSVDSGER